MAGSTKSNNKGSTGRSSKSSTERSTKSNNKGSTEGIANGSTERSNKGSTAGRQSLLKAYNIPRPRIDRLLDTATESKLVYIIAGAGYGKTQAVQNYIEQHDEAVVRRVVLTESDNIGSRYWENLTACIAFDNPELAERLREFGFPASAARFRQFADILRNSEHRSRKTFLILDDFHLIKSAQALTFAERCAHLSIPGACVIILTRTEPVINVVSLFAKGQVSIITEDDLRFTDDETAEFFKLRNIKLSAETLRRITDATRGWALAIQLLSLVLAKRPDDIDTALDVMRSNIFMLMESEAWNGFLSGTRKILARLSLISDLPLKVLREHLYDSAYIKDAPELASFIWYDSYTGQERVHPLYWEFLKTKQDILTEKDKISTYRQAAEWCLKNSFKLDAFKYMAASRQYSNMLGLLLSYPIKMPQDACEYYLDIIDSLNPAPDEQKDTNYLLLTNLFTPLLELGAAGFLPAQKRCFEYISHWKRSKDPAAMLMLCIAHSNLAYIDMYSCTVTHKYEAAGHLEKSLDYQRRSVIPPLELRGEFSLADVRSFACPIGEGADFKEFDEFLIMAEKTAQLIGLTTHNMYYGYDDLAACEIEFYKNNLTEAKRRAHIAVYKAREKKQYSIEAMAAMYLFRIAVSEGDVPVVTELFKQRNDSPETPYFWNRRFLYELGVSFFFAQSGITHMVPAWLAADDNENEYERTGTAGVPVRELICTARYYIASKQYGRALTLLCGAYPRTPQNRFAFGELTLTLLLSAAKIHTGNTDGAVEDFIKAYKLSYDGVFEMAFIELGRDCLLIAEAVADHRHKQRSIPMQWLKETERKANVYAKKTTVVLDAFRKQQRIDGSVSLSKRETEILTDLYHGLSREEIAANRYLSVNTVHKIIQSVFLKLDASNKADAIRIAIEKRILG